MRGKTVPYRKDPYFLKGLRPNRLNQGRSHTNQKLAFSEGQIPSSAGRAAMPAWYRHWFSKNQSLVEIRDDIVNAFNPN